ncbi:MAG: AEC family transporter, partial [Clostridia bacterium]|nr:AEC family transporter [Clostridia bacterium]
MESLIFSLNAVLPIIIMVIIGYVLKKIGFVDADFAKVINKLVFRVFLPVMLFLNVYKIENIAAYNFTYILYAAIAALSLFAIAIPVVIAYTPKNERRGVLLQAVFRSNYALIGLPLAGALFGEQGEIFASLMSVVTIPIFNILAVISLTIFNKEGSKPSVKKVAFGIVKNPLIQGIVSALLVLGIRAVFVNLSIDFRLSDITPVYKVLGYLSGLATPLALISLGIQFEFSAIKELKKEIIFGTLARTVVVPLICLSVAYFAFRDAFNGAHFAAFV